MEAYLQHYTHITHTHTIVNFSQKNNESSFDYNVISVDTNHSYTCCSVIVFELKSISTWLRFYNNLLYIQTIVVMHI